MKAIVKFNQISPYSHKVNLILSSIIEDKQNQVVSDTDCDQSESAIDEVIQEIKERHDRFSAMINRGQWIPPINISRPVNRG